MKKQAENKIEVLPINGSFTPQIMLAKAQESLPDIKRIAIVIEWEDETYSVSWSIMKQHNLTFLLSCFQEEIRAELFGDR